jgi:VanZ family protein
VEQPADISTEPLSPRRRRLSRWLWRALPLVVWLGVIAFNSTDWASGAHTDALLLKFVSLFSGGLGAGTEGFGALSWLVRKLGHVAEYAVLGALLAGTARSIFPGFIRGGCRESLWRTALIVVPCGMLVAIADELHQTVVASRFGKPTDAAIDLMGLVAGVLVMWLVWRSRARREPPPAPRGIECDQRKATARRAP